MYYGKGAKRATELVDMRQFQIACASFIVEPLYVPHP